MARFTRHSRPPTPLSPAFSPAFKRRGRRQGVNKAPRMNTYKMPSVFKTEGVFNRCLAGALFLSGHSVGQLQAAVIFQSPAYAPVVFKEYNGSAFSVLSAFS